MATENDTTTRGPASYSSTAIRAGDAGAPDRDPLMEFVSRWWWLLVLGVVVGATVAVAYAQYGPDTYSSTSLVQIQAQTENDPTAKAEQARSATANYAAEASSPRILGLVSDATGDEFTAAELSRMDRNGMILVQSMRNANFITIKVSHSDPNTARFLADTFAAVVVDDINARARVERDQRSAQLGEQIEFARQQLASAELFKLETDLELQVRDQRSQLLSLQASYQQELARQAETATRSSELTSIYGAYLAVVESQIGEVESTIASLNANLDEVRAAIDTLPDGSDAVLSGAYASAYAQELTTLTRQFVAQQLATVNSTPPLVQYGDASDALRVQSFRKLGLLGVAIGGTVAAGIAFGLDLLRKRRIRSTQTSDDTGDDADLERLLHRLNQIGAGPRSGATTDGSLAHRSSSTGDHGQSTVSAARYD